MISVTLILIFFTVIVLFFILRFNDYMWFDWYDKIFRVILWIAFVLLILALVAIALNEFMEVSRWFDWLG